MGKSIWLPLLPLLLGGMGDAKDYLNAKRRPNARPGAVLVLPARAEYTVLGLGSKQVLPAKGEDVAAELDVVASRALTQAGFSVAPSPFLAFALGKNATLRQALSQSQAGIDQLIDAIRKNPDDVKRGRFNWSASTGQANELPAADYLVGIRAEAWGTTKGRAFLKGAVVGGVLGGGIAAAGEPLTVDLRCWLVLLERNTGDVLLFTETRVATPKYGLSDRGRLEKNLTTVFKKLRSGQ